MSTFRKTLPPLDSLIFFQHVAKHGSFSKAAKDLFVTQAAASKRVQRLEDWLGTQLFDRNGRRITLNSAGKTLAADVELALEFLERSVAKVKTPEEPVIRIAAVSSISMFWLYDRIKQFSLSEHACHVNISSSDDMSKLTDEENDLAIVYSNGTPSGWVGNQVLSGDLAPAAPPGIAQEAIEAGAFTQNWDLERSPPLLEYTNLTPDWINWAIWLKRMKLPSIEELKHIQCASYGQSVGRSLTGHGILLANLELQKPELASGRLVRIGDLQLTPRKSYYLCYKNNGMLSPAARTLFDFLVTGS
ncbi:LysR family transcriptional regulator [Coralliovum pocilloporae]|uniref:LysR family transcriptional regulator n=1 Tax=Coralliovum pocilloporae TaxID=3066369 RepID=UPI003306CC98